jgi:hypothetical protein
MQTSSRVRRPVAVLVIALVAVVAAAGVAIGWLIARDEGNQTTTADSTAQVASVQQACQQWLIDSATQAGSAAWCSSMAEWMSEQMAANRMGPQMMWGDPDQMRETCQQWLTDRPAGVDVDAQQWCDDMVDWMDEHMGEWSGRNEWGDWMDHGPRMMGR